MKEEEGRGSNSRGSELQFLVNAISPVLPKKGLAEVAVSSIKIKVRVMVIV